MPAMHRPGAAALHRLPKQPAAAATGSGLVPTDTPFLQSDPAMTRTFIAPFSALLLAGACLGTALTASAQQAAAAQQQLLPAQSSIDFTIRQMGVPVQGHFKKFSAQVAFDPAKAEASSIVLTIDTGSATMGSRETDAELPKAEWFNVPKFPQATFRSSSVKAVDKTHLQVAGTLNIKGVPRDVVVPVTLAQSGSATTATGTLAIKRLGFQIGDGDWADTSMVADEVQVRFKLALTGVGALR